MPLSEGAVQRLQQEKPQTYAALEGFVSALATNPNDDASMASMVTAIAQQLAGPSPDQGARTRPQAKSNMATQPVDRAAVAAQMRPVRDRPMPGAPPPTA